jgi:periplasmic copper chaperone A
MKLLVLSFFISLGLSANPPQLISIKNASIKAMPPQSSVSAAYMEINNQGDEVSLVKVESDLSKNTEMHTVDMSGGKMKMRQVKEINLPSKKSVFLRPGSLHIMLINLKRDLIKGEKGKITFTFSNGQYITETIAIQ